MNNNIFGYVWIRLDTHKFISKILDTFGYVWIRVDIEAKAIRPGCTGIWRLAGARLAWAGGGLDLGADGEASHLQIVAETLLFHTSVKLVFRKHA